MPKIIVIRGSWGIFDLSRVSFAAIMYTRDMGVVRGSGYANDSLLGKTFEIDSENPLHRKKYSDRGGASLIKIDREIFKIF
jgi:hypothetical protein